VDKGAVRTYLKNLVVQEWRGEAVIDLVPAGNCVYNCYWSSTHIKVSYFRNTNRAARIGQRKKDYPQADDRYYREGKVLRA
jgi:hypothetical protein